MTSPPEKYSYLLDDSLEMRVPALMAHSRNPSGNPVVLPYLEAMLGDKRPCVVMLPIRYGEVRWLAAEALAAERKKVGINEAVHLPKAIHPLSHNKLYQIGQDAGMPSQKGWENEFIHLRELGLLPSYDIDFEPQVYGSWFDT